jgi:hypothetical protein
LNRVKARAQLDFAARQLSTMADLHAKQLETLATEMAAVEKAKRQLARRKKTEAQAIDENFEMQIGAQQITLQQAIDNIAKLYTKDENERGCHVIESVRKVREIHNHITDFLTRKRRELDFITQRRQGTSSELREKIQALEACKREKEIENEIAQSAAQSAAQLQEIERRMKARNERILQKSSEENSRIEAQIQTLENEMVEETSQFSGQISQLQGDLQDINRDTRTERDRIEAEFDARKERINREHEVAVERMNKRIANAKEQINELLTKSGTEKAALIQKNWDELERKSQEFSAHYAADCGRKESMNRTISELSQKESDAEQKLFSPTIRPADQKRIEVLLEKIQSMADLIDAGFEQFYGVIREAPKNAPIVQPPDSSRVSRSLNGTAGRKTRMDSGLSHVLTPVESKRRKPQFLITPQCI